MRLLLVAPLLFALPAELPSPKDRPVPPGTLTGPSSGRLALPVVLDVDAELARRPELPVQVADRPGQKRGDTTVPTEALLLHSLDVARRHFEDAEWSDDTRRLADEGAPPRAKKRSKNKKRGKGRFVVVKSVEIEAREGPMYTVRVIVDRIEDGRRLGQATGTGIATPDRTRERRSAAFAPGILGAVAARKASAPKADKDAEAIRMATLRALDSALLQLSAYWAGEQAAERYRR